MSTDAADLDVYRATRRRREAVEAAERAALRHRAWGSARDAADMLRTRFGARRVLVFGSLVDADGAFFDRHSDIDLAAWGITAQDFFVAVAQLQDISPEFTMDLVAMERCPEQLRPVVETTGVDL